MSVRPRIEKLAGTASATGSVDASLWTLTIAGKFDDTDIVHVIAENLIVNSHVGASSYRRKRDSLLRVAASSSQA